MPRKCPLLGEAHHPTEKPTIELQLYRDGQPYGVPVVLKSGETDYTWKALDITDKDGNPYIYTVDEVNVPKDYEKISNGDSLTVTNSYIIPKINITGRKIWVGGDDQRPDIQIQLYRNGVAYGDLVTFSNGDESYTWTSLDKTDIGGIEYKYIIDEVEVPEGYRKGISEDGLTITNNYSPYVPPVIPEEPEPTPDPKPIPKPTPKPEPKLTPTPRPEVPSYIITEVPNPNDPDSPDEFILIDEDGTPLGSYTKQKDANGNYIYVSDNEVPLGTPDGPRLPKTGETPIRVHYLLLFGLFTVILTIMSIRKFNRIKNK